jgi:glycosyltransferase involved in cell wall biosynthesis
VARILQIHTRYRESGGEDAVADAERRLLEDAGHEVIGVRRDNSASGPRAAAQLAGYTWNPLSTSAIMSVVDQTQPDIAHIHNTWFAVSPTVLRSLKKAGIPTVVTIHNYRLMCANAKLLRNGVPCELCVGSNPWPGVRYRCYRNNLAASTAAAFAIQAHRSLHTWRDNVDQFIALTDFSRERLIAAGLPAERIAVQPNFVADPGPRRSPPSASRTVAYIGRLSSEKGMHIALNAWIEAAPRGLELAIAGDGPERKKLEGLADSSVAFLGHLSRKEVDELLFTSRVALFPSLTYEGQPLGVLEAFAAGTPVLGSASGGLGETIAPLGAAWSVPAGDVGSWAEALSRITDEQFVNAGGVAARRAYDEQHTCDLALERRESTYERLCADRGPVGVSA